MSTKTEPSPFDFGKINIEIAADHNLRITSGAKTKEVSKTTTRRTKDAQARSEHDIP